MTEAHIVLIMCGIVLMMCGMVLMMCDVESKAQSNTTQPLPENPLKLLRASFEPVANTGIMLS